MAQQSGPQDRLADLWVECERSYTITALLVVVTIFLPVMSIQSVRLQTAYRHLQASYAATSINIRRVSALIDAIVME
jgi:hypothetical protein